MKIESLVHRNLIRIHKKSGLKKVDLAKKMGITKSSISHFFSGNRVVPMKRISELAKIYGVSEQEFLKKINHQ